MPVEVREMLIKATIVQDLNQGNVNNGNNGNDVSPSEEIIKVCVERVLGILKEKNER